MRPSLPARVPVMKPRSHTRDDEPRLAAMMLALDAEGAGIRATNPENVARTLGYLDADETRGAIAVVEIDARLVGYVMVFPLWAGEYGGLLSVVDELYVEPEFRSRGVGAALMDWVEVEARKRGHVAISLLAMNHNLRAHEFYRRRGYETIAGTSFDKLLR